MTSREEGHLEQIDVAILGGGPAGLQAALVLSRTRKKIVVFDI
jgi:thioredoxin reductase